MLSIDSWSHGRRKAWKISRGAADGVTKARGLGGGTAVRAPALRGRGPRGTAHPRQPGRAGARHDAAERAPERALAAALGGRPEAMTVSVADSAPHRLPWVNGTLGHSAESTTHTWLHGIRLPRSSPQRCPRGAEGSTGRDVLRSVVRLCRSWTARSVAGRGMLTAGWHGSKVLGCSIRPLRPALCSPSPLPSSRHAFGIAASDAGGTMEYDRAGGE